MRNCIFLSENFTLFVVFTRSLILQHINLGCGTEKLMDAIWVCEQSARELGYVKEDIPWKIYYRKEVYNPQEEFLIDIGWTDFAFNFVVNGIRSRVTRLKRVIYLLKLIF